MQRPDGADPVHATLASRSMRGSLLLGAVSLLVALGAAELFVRAFMPWPWYGHDPGRWKAAMLEHHSELGWHGKRGIREPFGSRDFAVSVRHDRSGHRSSAPPFDPTKRNVVAVGDSFGWGWGVEDDEVWSEQLMRRDPSFNVYNLSAPGWGTDQEYLELKGFLERHPDASYEWVVLVFYRNDFDDVLARVELGGVAKPRFALREGNLVLRDVPLAADATGVFEGKADPPPAETHLLRRLQLANLIDRGLPRLFRSGRHGVGYTPPPEGVALVARLVQTIDELATARGARLIVALCGDWRAERYPELERFLEESDIAFTVLAPRRIPQTHLWKDGHLSARGHARLAEALLERLEVGS